MEKLEELHSPRQGKADPCNRSIARAFFMIGRHSISGQFFGANLMICSKGEKVFLCMHAYLVVFGCRKDRNTALKERKCTRSQ